MARRGRPPTPTALKLIKGNPGKRPVKAEPKPPPSKPRRPQWLVGYARQEWDRVVPFLDGLGLLTVVDRTVIAAYCEAAAGLKAASSDLRKRGYLVDSARGDGYQIKNPSNQLLKDYARLVSTYSSMLGLSPGDRVRLSGEARPSVDLGLEAALQ
jgi:P27 family predicted phage terminase small subunit